MSIKINYPEIVLSLTKWKKTEYPNNSTIFKCRRNNKTKEFVNISRYFVYMYNITYMNNGYGSTI